MKLGGNTILITGGGSGIGLALAKRFLAAESEVILCGRRQQTLETAKRECPKFHTFVCDVSQASERVRLAQRLTSDFPRLNVIINNAGVQNRPPSVLQSQEWSDTEREIATNLSAPIHLAMLFAPHLAKQKAAAIINVTSGLSFSPLAFMPVYCATKAALHSFTLSLRHQLVNTSVSVIEVVPPAVQTDLGGKGLHDFGVPLEAFADHAVKGIASGELEFGYQLSEKARLASRQELDAIFKGMNAANQP